MKRTLLAALWLTATWLSTTAAQAQELPRRAFAGIGLTAVPDSLLQKYRLPAGSGILVTNVREQSSAKAAGLLAQDIVLQLGDTKVQGVPQFVGLLKQYRTGDKVPLTVLRGGKTLRKRLEFKPFPKDQSANYTAEYSSVRFGQNQLRTIITRPVGGKPGQKYPMVLFIQGVGCFSIDNPLSPAEPTNHIIDALSARGYATMRVDKTGMGDSQGIPCAESDFQTELGGYKAGLAAIRQLPFVDQDNVFLTGFSIGGIMAPLVAQGAGVKGVVAWGTASRTFIEYLLQNKRNQSQLQGMPADQVNEQQRLYAAVLHLLFTDKQTPEQVLARYPQARDLLRFPQHYTYMRQWQEANLEAAWKNVHTNVLVLRGTADYISYNEDHQLIVDIVNREHPGKATFQQMPDVDHGFTRARSQQESMQLADASDPEKNYDFLQVIIRWLDEKQKLKA